MVHCISAFSKKVGDFVTTSSLLPPKITVTTLIISELHRNRHREKTVADVFSFADVINYLKKEDEQMSQSEDEKGAFDFFVK